MTITAERYFAVTADEHARIGHSWSGQRHVFDTRARAVLSCTLVLGGLVAVAPAIPAAVRSYDVFAGLLLWTGVVLWGTISAARLATRSLRGDFATVATGLAAMGIAVAALASTQLEIIRVLYDRPALTWNIDWRFHLNHAQAIARYGGLASALDYAGVPVDYHVGPAWLAGATERVLGYGLYGVSFGLVPLLSILSTAIATLYLLHLHGIPYRLSAAAAAIAMTLPGLHIPPAALYYSVAAGNPDTLSGAWTFSSALMLNANFGLAVGSACLALLLDRRSRGWQVALSSVGVASLVELKPQYAVGVGLVAALLGIERLVGRSLLGPRTTRVITAVAAALAIGMTLTAVLPSAVSTSMFAHPVWAPGRTGYSLSELFTTATLLSVLSLAIWSAIGASKGQRALIGVGTATYIGATAFSVNRSAQLLLLFTVAGSSIVIARGRPTSGPTRCYGLLTRLAVCMAILVGTLYLVSFPLRADAVVQAQRLVEPGFAATSEQGNLSQALTPLRLLLVTTALGLLTLCAVQGNVWWRRVFVMAGAVGVVSLVPLIIFDFAHPSRGHEAAEDVGLFQTLQQVPHDGHLLIANDLADPAENYRRPLRSFLLTGYAGHAFYVANLRYLHYTRPDAGKRLDELRAFFGSPWSAWHEGWLERAGVGYVLVSDRCLPVWFGQPALPLRALAHHGHWSAYDTRGARVLDPPADMPTAHEITPRFGAQGCLSFTYMLPAERQ